MIQRDILSELLVCVREYPVVTIIGPRQSGKTTLAQTAFPDKPYRSLEDPDVRMAAQTDPRGFLAQVPDGAILDEIQRVPDLLSYIQGLVDRERRPGMFILTGSHQPRIQQGVSQTLAGRTALLTLMPFSLAELRHYRTDWTAFDLVVTGAFPPVHDQRLAPSRFFNGYVQTYVERDVRALVNLKDLRPFQQFLILLAGRIGQVVNYTALSNDVGVSTTTIKHWIGVLKASFLVFEMAPFFENVRKRVVKSPKIYFTDTGLAAHLLGLTTREQVARDPLRGGLYENLIIMDIAKALLNRGQRPDLYFYRDTNGCEVDLLIRQGRNLLPMEIKSASTFTPEFLRGIKALRTMLGESCLPGAVLYDGTDPFEIHGTQVINPLVHTAALWQFVGVPQR